MIFTTQREREQRMAICKACKHFQSTTNSCGTLIVGNTITKGKKKVHLCGCVMPIKTQFKTSSCPIGSWQSTVDTQSLEEIKEILEKADREKRITGQDGVALVKTYNKIFGTKKDVNNAMSCGNCMREIIKEFKEIIKNK